MYYNVAFIEAIHSCYSAQKGRVRVATAHPSRNRVNPLLVEITSWFGTVF